MAEIEHLPVDEAHPLAPVDVNGINKLAAERYYTLYHDVHRIPTVLKPTFNSSAFDQALRRPFWSRRQGSLRVRRVKGRPDFKKLPDYPPQPSTGGRDR